jgi:hypothetical protein
VRGSITVILSHCIQISLFETEGMMRLRKAYPRLVKARVTSLIRHGKCLLIALPRDITSHHFPTGKMYHVLKSFNLSYITKDIFQDNIGLDQPNVNYLRHWLVWLSKSKDVFWEAKNPSWLRTCVWDFWRTQINTSFYQSIKQSRKLDWDWFPKMKLAALTGILYALYFVSLYGNP